MLGKTVGSQWANYRSPGRAPNGWSAVGGQCLGTYHENLNPSGSSSGSAVATAAGLAAATLGTEVNILPVLALYLDDNLRAERQKVASAHLPSDRALLV